MANLTVIGGVFPAIHCVAVQSADYKEKRIETWITATSAVMTFLGETNRLPPTLRAQSKAPAFAGEKVWTVDVTTMGHVRSWQLAVAKVMAVQNRLLYGPPPIRRKPP